MRASPPGRTRPSLALLGLCLSLGAVVYLEARRDPAESAAGAAASAPSEPVRGLEPAEEPGLGTPGLAGFAEIVERPLFRPSRRPLPPEAKDEAARRAAENPFALIGVVISADKRVALLRQRGSPEFLRVVEGQRAEGWLVEAILPDRVILADGDVIEVLELRDAPRPQAAPPARGPRAGPQGPLSRSAAERKEDG